MGSEGIYPQRHADLEEAGPGWLIS